MVAIEPRPAHAGVAAFLARTRAHYTNVADLQPRLKPLRAYANWARVNLELRRRAARIHGRPLKLTIDATNLCQLRCALCPTGLRLHDRPAGHAGKRLFERLLDELGDCVFFLDFFNWGEPLLNPHLEDYIAMAAARRIVCTVSTNLSLPLSDDRVHRLLTCGLAELVVSLDGATAETYAIYRRRGNFELVCRNLRRIAAEKRRLRRATPVITWQFLVFRFNEHEIEAAKRLAEEWGVDRLALRPPMVETDRYPLDETDRDPDGWLPRDPRFRMAASSGAPAAGRPCAWHYMASAINWDGGVAPCCTLYEHRHDFGTLGAEGQTPYMQIQNNAAYRAIRDRFAGRGAVGTGLVCERCPSPSIQRLDRYLNREIAYVTLAAAAGALRRVFNRARS